MGPHESTPPCDAFVRASSTLFPDGKVMFSKIAWRFCGSFYFSVYYTNDNREYSGKKNKGVVKGSGENGNLEFESNIHLVHQNPVLGVFTSWSGNAGVYIYVALGNRHQMGS